MSSNDYVCTYHASKREKKITAPLLCFKFVFALEYISVLRQLIRGPFLHSKSLDSNLSL